MELIKNDYFTLYELEEKVYSKANRINSISVTVQEDVLFFEMVIPIRTVMYLDIDKVKDNYLTENIK